MEFFKDGRAPLHMVIREEIADVLIQAKANVNVQQDDGATPLFVAAEHNLLPVAQKLLACDANPCLTLEVRIPLLERRTVMASTLSHGMPTHLALSLSQDGATPFFVACQFDYRDMAELLMSDTRIINQPRNDGASPLYIACHAAHRAVAQLLLLNSADVNKCLKDTNVGPLYITAQNGVPELLTQLIEAKANVNETTSLGIAPLHMACLRGTLSKVKALVEGRANVNQVIDEDKSTPLLIACSKLRPEIDLVAYLLDNNADINARLKV